MKKLILILMSSYATLTLAAEKKNIPMDVKSEVKKNTTAADLNTQTQHSFEDILVQGQFHFSNEAVTTVEEDKVLDSLIGVRTDFKDRIEKSATRY